MSNQVMKLNPAVPAFLQKTSLWGVGEAAAAGISGGSPPRISYRAGRFRYVSGDGVVTDSAEHNGVALDVIVVGANEHVSKLYYSKPYDPAGDENAQPDCYSDNGTAPSARASQPQSPTCAACPHNVWGSKVTPTGSQVKACSDLKKLAVVPIANLDGSAYLLTIPAASLKGWKAVVSELVKRGCPVGAFVFRCQFDTTASYPKLVFVPQRWISEAEVAKIEDLIGSDDVTTLVGGDDQPMTSGDPRPVQPTNVYHTTNAPAASSPAPIVVPPATPDPHPVAPPPGMPEHTAQALAVPPKKRGRPKAEPAAAPPPAAPQKNDGLDIPLFLQRPKPADAQPVVQPATSDIDAMLDGIMGTGGR